MSNLDSSADENKWEFFPRDGRAIISTAREAIHRFLSTGELMFSEVLLSDKRFKNKYGCFTSLKSNNQDKTLRGCVGFPEPVYALYKALTESAIAAATQDPRFTPVKIGDLNSLLVEVSILTSPKLIKVNSQVDLPGEINVGKDGLILKWPFGSGLLLPQVANEFGWAAEEFLCNVSMKAGAPPDQWL